MPKSSLASRMLYYFLKHTELLIVNLLNLSRKYFTSSVQKLYSTYNIELNKVDNGNFCCVRKNLLKKMIPLSFTSMEVDLLKALESTLEVGRAIVTTWRS